MGIQKINAHRQNFTNSPDLEVIFTDYFTTGSFDQTVQSKFDTARLFRKGASVVFSIAVSLTIANQTAANEEDKTLEKKQHWVVGVDVDQGISVNNESPTSFQRKGKILVSATLKIKEILGDLIKDIESGKEKQGRSILVQESKYLSIPERFKKDST